MTPRRPHPVPRVAIRGSARPVGGTRTPPAGRRVPALLASSLLLAAAWMLPLQIGAGPGRMEGHGGPGATMMGAAGTKPAASRNPQDASRAPSGVPAADARSDRHRPFHASEAPGAPDGESHDHGAECFWCLAFVGTVVAAAMAARVDATDAYAVPASIEPAGRRPAILDAAPRAPPLAGLQPA